MKISSTAFVRLVAEHPDIEVWFEPVRDTIFNARFEGRSAEKQCCSSITKIKKPIFG